MGANAGVFGEIHPFVLDGFFAANSPDGAFHDEVAIETSDIVVEKPRYGAFYGTDLEVILRSRGIESVIVGGIATAVCCDTTAREAMVCDFRVFFLDDGTTTGPIGEVPAEQAHAIAIARLGALFAHVISVDDMIQHLRRAGQPPG